jgi:hypothetical protein
VSCSVSPASSAGTCTPPGSRACSADPPIHTEFDADDYPHLQFRQRAAEGGAISTLLSNDYSTLETNLSTQFQADESALYVNMGPIDHPRSNGTHSIYSLPVTGGAPTAI